MHHLPSQADDEVHIKYLQYFSPYSCKPEAEQPERTCSASKQHAQTLDYALQFARSASPFVLAARNLLFMDLPRVTNTF